jgi:hypothetical protein
MFPILWNLRRYRRKFHYADVAIMPVCSRDAAAQAGNLAYVSA